MDDWMEQERVREYEARDYQNIECPYCSRIMSQREAKEQHACNDCYTPR